MKRVLITGGLGFLGANLVHHLRRSGYAITILDKQPDSKGSSLSPKDVSYISHDLCNFEGLPALVDGFMDIIHLAATSDTRESGKYFRVDLDNSLVATWNLLEALRTVGSKPRLLFTSSQHVYGPRPLNQADTIREEDQMNPVSPYAAAKVAAESIIAVYSRVHGIRTSILRLSNIVGAGENFGVLVDVLHNLKTNPHRLVLWGNGQQRRNFLHVSDLCACISTILEQSSHKAHQVFNVANTHSISVVELANIVVDELGLTQCEVSPSSSDNVGWSGDPGSILPNIDKISALGWRPAFDCSNAIRQATRELADTRL